jgi:tetratricopeptide (TPR) repeat protein
MFDRVNDAISGGGSGDADAEHLDGLLRDGEQLQHALANDGTIEHTEDGRTTTIESGGGHGAYMLVTDERVLWVLGDQPETAEIAFGMTRLQTCHLRKGLLNSKLEVQTYDETVVFDPDEGDAEAAEDYISNVGSSWADMSSALSQARDAIAAYEDACGRGEDPNQHALAARSQFSQARRAATREDRAPEGKIRAEIRAVVEELAHTRVTSWLDRVESQYEDVEAALDEGRYGDACEAYVDAAEVVEEASDVIDDVDDVPEGAAERLEAVEADLREAGERFLDGAAGRCERALDAEEATVAVDAWEEAFDRYRAAADAGWNGHAPVSEGALEYQLTWVTAGLLEAMSAHAGALEREGDETDDSDEAGDYYEDAEEWFERARDLADERPHHDPADYETERDRLEEKRLESAGWEFGG